MASRIKTKGRRNAGTFFGLPHAVMDSANYLRLSTKAVKLLNDIGRQYNGFNNGDLCAAFSIMRPRGWVSKGTLAEALEELLHYGLIMVSRQGGRHKATLYAVTWQAIDECKGKIDIRATTTAPALWKEDREKFIPKRKARKLKNLPRYSNELAITSGQSRP